jgi:hypothetical protein
MDYHCGLVFQEGDGRRDRYPSFCLHQGRALRSAVEADAMRWRKSSAA